MNIVPQRELLNFDCVWHHHADRVTVPQQRGRQLEKSLCIVPIDGRLAELVVDDAARSRGQCRDTRDARERERERERDGSHSIATYNARSGGYSSANAANLGLPSCLYTQRSRIRSLNLPTSTWSVFDELLLACNVPPSPSSASASSSRCCFFSSSRSLRRRRCRCLLLTFCSCS